MDTKRIRILFEIIESGSLSKAAEKMNYSKSAFTHLIKSVEDELGVTILVKSHNGVTLTDEGSQLIPFMQKLIKIEDALKKEAELLKNQQKNVIRISSYPSIANNLLGNAIKAFKIKYPEYDIALSIDSGSAVADKVINGDADFGFTDIYNLKSLEWIQFYSDEMVMVAPKSWISDDTPVTFEITNYYPFLASDYIAGLLSHHFESFTPKKMVRLAADSGTSIMAMVSNELGICIVSHLDIGYAPKNVQIIKTDPVIKRPLVMASLSFANLSPSAKIAVEFFKNYQWI